MAKVNIKKNVSKPVIVISGDYGVGKSYINKLIKKYLNSVVNINKYDFITRKLLYILKVHPLQVGYALLASDKVDSQLYNNNTKINYLRDRYDTSKQFTPDMLEYFIINILGVEKSIISGYNEIEKYVLEWLNIIATAKNKVQYKSKLYEVTKILFDNVINAKYKWDVQSNVNSYLSSRMKEFNLIFDTYHYRMVYYAYSPEEVQYFKDNYECVNVYVSMNHVQQSQLLLKDEKKKEVKDIATSWRSEEVKRMASLADVHIENNLELDGKLINKVMSSIGI
jgi:dephospho-CoA kinase